MHTWPSQSRARNYPLLQHGRLEAATLVDSDGQLAWSSLVSSQSPSAPRFRIHKSTAVFPPTKPPPLSPLNATVNQRADHGAHFLRTHFPEVDISANMIRDQVAEDAYEAAALSQFDPFEGNTLDVVTDYDNQTHLVFPMGELGSELNVSPILSAGTGKATLRPTTTPIRTFSTPIQQIASPPKVALDLGAQRDMLFGVRTFGATSILKFDSDSSSTAGLTDVTHFTSQDTGEASIVDFRILAPGAPFEALFINKLGALYGSSFSGGKKTIIKLHAGQNSSNSTFRRIGIGMKQTECTILSANDLNQLDFRSNRIDSLFSNPAPSDILTSVEDFAQDGLVRLCSTSQIIWLDPRYLGRPLLGYKHHRQFDRTLRTTTLFVDSSPYTFLSTKHNGLISIYSVSRHEDQLIRVDDAPYGSCLPGTYRSSAQTFWQQDSQNIFIFRADERAKVDFISLCRADPGTEPECGEALVVEASDAVKELERKCTNVETDLDKYGDQDKVITDLSPAYDNIFRIQAEQQQAVEEEQAEEFYDVMDVLPTFWQINDVPSEHMLTSYDIVYRSHEVSDKSSRSDFAAGSLLNSSRGYQVLSRDQFPIESLRKGVPWHLDISHIQRHIDPSLDLDTDVRELAESLHSYDLLDDDERTALSIRRENRAREQLAVDLVLSRDIYSPSAFTSPRGAEYDLETMTEALSLGGDQADEPPEVEFGRLRPVSKAKAMDHYEKDKDTETNVEGGDSGKVSLAMGVRLLLKDWEVGTKSKDYVFRDPYNTTDERTPRLPVAAKSRDMSSVPNASSQPVRSQRPPPVMSSQVVAGESGNHSLVKKPPIVVQSQDTFLQPSVPVQSSATGLSQPSQPSQPSTQIFPGPHGGRPLTTKKKLAKKRVSGF
ncbi:hypothetical protein Agabi119p4_2996 [Agaricus bisporus var. burnettii]|uniref:Uncharacterized protein n=1 Tax=Agaricus bisporus var. burnettii TaxID=192524 RepID=A0A8H7F6B4_AGABI|nr:hypothetical protein Agabi119p4_2996 [Agaricus bisporus var. burnettii]